MLLGDTPNLHALLGRAAYSMWARTTPNSITLPSHISMMTGVSPRRHDVEWNREFKTVEPLYPRVPTLFEAAKRHGYTTAVAAGKSKFEMFDRPGVLDWRFIPTKPTVETANVIGPACQIIREHRPEVMLIHLPSVDNAGHSKGWASPEQMKAIADADVAIGMLLQTLDEAGLADSTLLIVTADHGGAGKNHGPDDPRQPPHPLDRGRPRHPAPHGPDDLPQAHDQHRGHLRHRLLDDGHPAHRPGHGRRPGEADPGAQAHRVAPPDHRQGAGELVTALRRPGIGRTSGVGRCRRTSRSRVAADHPTGVPS